MMCGATYCMEYGLFRKWCAVFHGVCSMVYFADDAVQSFAPLAFSHSTKCHKPTKTSTIYEVVVSLNSKTLFFLVTPDDPPTFVRLFPKKMFWWRRRLKEVTTIELNILHSICWFRLLPDLQTLWWSPNKVVVSQSVSHFFFNIIDSNWTLEALISVDVYSCLLQQNFP